MDNKEDTGMKVRDFCKLYERCVKAGEFIYGIYEMKKDTLYGFRINLFNNFEYLDDCINISDEFIKNRINYIIENKISHDKIVPWDELNININNVYIIFYIDSSTICFSPYGAKKYDPFNRNIDYKEWVIKGILE